MSSFTDNFYLFCLTTLVMKISRSPDLLVLCKISSKQIIYMPSSRDCRNWYISQKALQANNLPALTQYGFYSKEHIPKYILTKQSHPTAAKLRGMWNSLLQSPVIHLQTKLTCTPSVLPLSSPHAPFITPLKKLLTASLGYLPHMVNCWKGPAVCKKLCIG